MTAGRTLATDARPTTHRLASVLLCAVAPLVIAAAAAVVALSWAPELPSPVATHWGPSGPDGFGSVTGLVVGTTVVTLVLAAAATALALAVDRQVTARRMSAGLATGVAAALATVLLGTLHAQRGLADARDAGGVGATVAAMVAVGLLAGCLAAWATPGDTPLPAGGGVDPAAPRVPLAAHERAAWTRTATGRPGIVIGGTAVVLVTGAALATRTPGLLALVAALVALLGCMTVFRVRVDAHGLTARSALGWPALHVPLEEVEAARVVDVHPLRDFGGWGYRISLGGRVGVVLRRGEAVEVHRSGDRVVVVTVDDAATGAALLNTLADRSRSAAPE
ncbi:DUF1648 domain-containing protein [Cellulomonas shaoxiangyii]|uniref:DUF1648 domain-containing protein n=1 Tax=Cellulomonas shaoxiangyii TaxID=2566013 RepID=A0A4P7SII0_9CELL|nr:DUF1648 domain-containing protein [Cellulomonas shaoxiangyii]QCB94049.1 DUF1648 domain-containing protein [Cellulomonas shaoxiangyii]TGY85762.1 DUF1648 domain-containing protein [Cellulomonas shaoxiangyii]